MIDVCQNACCRFSPMCVCVHCGIAGQRVSECMPLTSVGLKLCSLLSRLNKMCKSVVAGLCRCERVLTVGLLNAVAYKRMRVQNLCWCDTAVQISFCLIKNFQWEWRGTIKPTLHLQYWFSPILCDRCLYNVTSSRHLCIASSRIFFMTNKNIKITRTVLTWLCSLSPSLSFSFSLSFKTAMFIYWIESRLIVTFQYGLT